MSLSDAFLSLHGSEGWGLPVFEAMMLGKPVILTAYSGPMDYARRSNSLFTSYVLRELGQNMGPYNEGDPMALANESHAYDHMQWLLGNPQRGRHIGARAKKTVRKHLSKQVIGARIGKILRLCFERPGHAPYRAFSRRVFAAESARLARAWQSPTNTGVLTTMLRRFAYSLARRRSAQIVRECVEISRQLDEMV
jgi:hypothetical protein